MNCSIVPLVKFGQDMYIFIRVLVGEISGHFIAQRSVDALHDRAFDVGISTDLKLYTLTFWRLLKLGIQKLFSLIRTHPHGASAYKFRVSRVV